MLNIEKFGNTIRVYVPLITTPFTGQLSEFGFCKSTPFGLIYFYSVCEKLYRKYSIISFLAGLCFPPRWLGYQRFSVSDYRFRQTVLI